MVLHRFFPTLTWHTKHESIAHNTHTHTHTHTHTQVLGFDNALTTTQGVYQFPGLSNVVHSGIKSSAQGLTDNGGKINVRDSFKISFNTLIQSSDCNENGEGLTLVFFKNQPSAGTMPAVADDDSNASYGYRGLPVNTVGIIFSFLKCHGVAIMKDGSVDVKQTREDPSDDTSTKIHSEKMLFASQSLGSDIDDGNLHPVEILYDADARRMRIQITDTNNGVGGSTPVVRYQPFDIDLPLHLGLDDSQDEVWMAFRATTGGDGFTSASTGCSTMTTSNFQVRREKTKGSASIVYGEGLHFPQASGPANVTIQAMSSNGRRRGAGGDSMQIRVLDGPTRNVAVAPTAAVDNGDGSYTAYFHRACAWSLHSPGAMRVRSMHGPKRLGRRRRVVLCAQASVNIVNSTYCSSLSLITLTHFIFENVLLSQVVSPCGTCLPGGGINKSCRPGCYPNSLQANVHRRLKEHALESPRQVGFIERHMDLPRELLLDRAGLVAHIGYEECEQVHTLVDGVQLGKGLWGNAVFCWYTSGEAAGTRGSHFIISGTLGHTLEKKRMKKRTVQVCVADQEYIVVVRRFPRNVQYRLARGLHGRISRVAHLGVGVHGPEHLEPLLLVCRHFAPVH